MNKVEDVRTALQDFILNFNSPVFIGEVATVDAEKVTCSVRLVSNPAIEIKNIRLRAVDDEQDKGFVLYPKVGSTILVGKIENLSAYYVAMFSELEHVVINGGENGGLVISQNTANKLNAIEKKMNDLASIFNQWTPAPSDGGAALKSLLTVWGQPLTITKSKDLENPKVKH
jgi:hypothetical protein